MAIEGFSPSHSPPPSPYYQLLERGFVRLGRVNKIILAEKTFVTANSTVGFLLQTTRTYCCGFMRLPHIVHMQPYIEMTALNIYQI